MLGCPEACQFQLASPDHFHGLRGRLNSGLGGYGIEQPGANWNANRNPLAGERSLEPNAARIGLPLGFRNARLSQCDSLRFPYSFWHCFKR